MPHAILHDSMFETQNELKIADLEAKAARLKPDPAAFNSCLTSGNYAQRVQQDQREGYTLGVMGAPVLFINGRDLSGAPTLADLSKIINEEISLSSHKLRIDSDTNPDASRFNGLGGGHRRAVGAGKARVTGMVFRQSMRPAATGSIVGGLPPLYNICADNVALRTWNRHL